MIGQTNAVAKAKRPSKKGKIRIRCLEQWEHTAAGTVEHSTICAPLLEFFFQPIRSQRWQRLRVHAFVVLRTISPMEREEHLTPVWHCQIQYSNWEIWNTHRIFRIITHRLSISTDARLCVQYLYDWPLFPLLVDVDVPSTTRKLQDTNECGRRGGHPSFLCALALPWSFFSFFFWGGGRRDIVVLWQLQRLRGQVLFSGKKYFTVPWKMGTKNTSLDDEMWHGKPCLNAAGVEVILALNNVGKAIGATLGRGSGGVWVRS